MSETITHRTTTELEAGLDFIRQSPKSEGKLEAIVRRPAEEARETLSAGEISAREGLAGDIWKTLPSARSKDGSAHPDEQLTLMNTRLIDLIAGQKARWPLAGDQLYVDLDLSIENLPPGTRLALGETALVEITSVLHSGCTSFSERYGVETLRWVNSKVGRELRLRGVYARVITPGTIRVGETVRVVSRAILEQSA